MESINSHNFLYSCVDEKKRSNEQFVPEHLFGIILSGESHFHTEQGIQIYGAGTIGLIRRNQLIKTVKAPVAGQVFKSINIVFGQEFLHRYAAEHSISVEKYIGASMLQLNRSPFLVSYFDSLMPYFQAPEKMTDLMAELKTREALELLLQDNPFYANLLFDFSEPFKIDLEAFMIRNYTFNVSLAQFAKLTGRSLSTFKRDFQKIFRMPPEKWLQHKRLEHAHFLLSQKQQQPIEIYLEVGFENLSHFSTAFKNFYGYSPSSFK